MGRAYSDDLRMRIAEADERGEGSCRVLAKRFSVSWEYVRKLRQQRKKYNTSARRVQSRYGVPSRLNEQVKARILALIEAQPDITIAEIRDRLNTEQIVSASWSSVRRWVVCLGLRLKKNRSMPANATAQPTNSSANSSLIASARLRLNA